jgi:hypothetical protein
MLSQKNDPEKPTIEMPMRKLELMYIESFLKSKGFSLDSLEEMDPEVARKLLVDASVIASSKLAEIETRAKLFTEMHETQS